MVLRKTSMKRKRKELCPSPLLDEIPKRPKVQAQRKFAQGSNVNSPVITPIRELECELPRANVIPEPVELLPMKRPNTEDFLTFLCFRGTPILPPNLNFFNTASIVDTNGQVHEIKSESSPKNGPIDIAKCGTSSEKPFIAFGVRKRADPIVISKQMDRKRRHALAIQALRRKYQEQKMAKIRALTISKLSEKTTNKTMVKTNTVSKTETVTKKNTTLQKTKVVATKHVKVTTRTLKTTLRPKIKPKMCLRSFQGRFVQKELPFRNKKRVIPEKKVVEKIKEKKKVLKKRDKIEETKKEVEYSSEDDAPIKTVVQGPKTKGPVLVKKKRVETSAASSNDSGRVTRSGLITKKVPTKLNARIKQIKKRILLATPKTIIVKPKLRSTTLKKTVISQKKAKQRTTSHGRDQVTGNNKNEKPDKKEPNKVPDSIKTESNKKNLSGTRKDAKEPEPITKRDIRSLERSENKKEITKNVDIKKEIIKTHDNVKKDIRKNVNIKKVISSKTDNKEVSKNFDLKKEITIKKTVDNKANQNVCLQKTKKEVNKVTESSKKVITKKSDKTQINKQESQVKIIEETVDKPLKKMKKSPPKTVDPLPKKDNLKKEAHVEIPVKKEDIKKDVDESKPKRELVVKEEVVKKEEPVKKKMISKTSDKETVTPRASQRPSRKTKEAAAIYMEILSHKLVNESKIDDDNISIDSFPELPNVKKTEQRENELKAQAQSTKDDVKDKSKQKEAKESDVKASTRTVKDEIGEKSKHKETTEGELVLLPAVDAKHSLSHKTKGSKEKLKQKDGEKDKSPLKIDEIKTQNKNAKDKIKQEDINEADSKTGIDEAKLQPKDKSKHKDVAEIEIKAIGTKAQGSKEKVKKDVDVNDTKPVSVDIGLKTIGAKNQVKCPKENVKKDLDVNDSKLISVDVVKPQIKPAKEKLKQKEVDDDEVRSVSEERKPQVKLTKEKLKQKEIVDNEARSVSEERKPQVKLTKEKLKQKEIVDNEARSVSEERKPQAKLTKEKLKQKEIVGNEARSVSEETKLTKEKLRQKDMDSNIDVMKTQMKSPKEKLKQKNLDAKTSSSDIDAMEKEEKTEIKQKDVFGNETKMIVNVDDTKVEAKQQKGNIKQKDVDESKAEKTVDDKAKFKKECIEVILEDKLKAKEKTTNDSKDVPKVIKSSTDAKKVNELPKSKKIEKLTQNTLDKVIVDSEVPKVCKKPKSKKIDNEKNVPDLFRTDKDCSKNEAIAKVSDQIEEESSLKSGHSVTRTVKRKADNRPVSVWAEADSDNEVLKAKITKTDNKIDTKVSEPENKSEIDSDNEVLTVKIKKIISKNTIKVSKEKIGKKEEEEVCEKQEKKDSKVIEKESDCKEENKGSKVIEKESACKQEIKGSKVTETETVCKQESKGSKIIEKEPVSKQENKGFKIIIEDLVSEVVEEKVAKTLKDQTVSLEGTAIKDLKEKTIEALEEPIPKKSEEPKEPSIPKRLTRYSSQNSQNTETDDSDESFHVDVKVPRKKKLTRSKAKTTKLPSPVEKLLEAPKRPSSLKDKRDIPNDSDQSTTSDINLKTLQAKTKNKKFTKTKSLKKLEIDFSDSDEEPLSRLTKSVKSLTENEKPISEKNLVKDPEKTTKKVLKPVEVPKLDTKPKRECAKRPQNYLSMLSSSEDENEQYFHGFSEKTEIKKPKIPFVEQLHAPPSLDLLGKDIGRKEKVNMSNEQIEKWLKDSAMAGSSIRKENDAMLKFGERIPTETSLDVSEHIDTNSLKASLLVPEKPIKTAQIQEPDAIVLDEDKTVTTKTKCVAKPLAVDRKLIFRKDKKEAAPNISAFSPENECSVYAFGEENEELISTPFRRPSRRPSSTATSRSEDESSRHDDSSKTGHFRKPPIKQELSKFSREDTDTSNQGEPEETSHSFNVPQNPCKLSKNYKSDQPLSASKTQSTATLISKKPPMKTTDKIFDIADDIKYKIPSSPSASSSSSAKLYKRQTQKQKIRPPETFSATYVSDFPKNTDPAKLVEAPVFHPTEQEFQDPLEYIERIRHKAEQFGICRIVPPSSFKPECRVTDDMRFTSYNQYVHKMLHRWGPNFKELMAIRKYLATQNIIFKHPPWIGGMEIDLPRLYQTVQSLGGLKEVIEKKRWPRVSECMKIPKSAQDRVTKLDDIYCKYLLPYDTLSPAERENLFAEVEKEWVKREYGGMAKAQLDAEEEESESDDSEAEECIVKGRSMALNAFYRIARNTMSMHFRTVEPSAQEVEQEFWKYVTQRKNHICVHSGSIDCGNWGYGFAVTKNSPFARHAWNLKVLTNNSGSVLRSLGPAMGVTIPTLHVGMVFSACCWYRDPHGLSWIEYLHTGGSKIWYGIPNSTSELFHSSLKQLKPNYCRSKELWLPSDTVMVPPNLLVKHNVSLCRTVQEPGQFIVVFPKAFTSSISTGYVVSESVYFAPPYWLKTARSLFDDLRSSCEASMFSLDRLLLSIASDARSSVDVLRLITPYIQELCDKEKELRCKLRSFGAVETERLPLPEVSNRKKKKKQQHGAEGEYECEECRMDLFISMVVDTQDEITYCLDHAISLLEKNNASIEKFKLVYTYDDEELDGIIGRLKSSIETKLQKKIPGKFHGMPTLLK